MPLRPLVRGDPVNDCRTFIADQDNTIELACLVLHGRRLLAFASVTCAA
jgi:hypothetical protein